MILLLDPHFDCVFLFSSRPGLQALLVRSSLLLTENQSANAAVSFLFLVRWCRLEERAVGCNNSRLVSTGE